MNCSNICVSYGVLFILKLSNFVYSLVIILCMNLYYIHLLIHNVYIGFYVERMDLDMRQVLSTDIYYSLSLFSFFVLILFLKLLKPYVSH